MKCSNCGQEIPSGLLYCEYCGEEVCIVPDYNPLEDMLAAQVKMSINNNESDSLDFAVKKQQNNRKSPTKRTIDEREARRRQAERRRALKRKKRRRLLIIMMLFIALIIGFGVFLYQTSYTGIMNKGNTAFDEKDYKNAQMYYNQAVEKNPKQVDAYIGLANIYIAKSDAVRAENIYLDALKAYPDETSIYEACIQFYLDTDQALEIPELIADASTDVQSALDKYIVDAPEFSLKSGVVYDDVQQLTLISSHKTIYYTTNGTNPTFSSAKYESPIQLDEGETTIKAIAVDKSGVPSLPSEMSYIIELPIEDAPAVSPSTGQYDESTKIEIKVPEGYTAYYTMDGSTPTTASTKYYGPVDMPEEDTLFKAILVSESGRYSGVTTRNYILDLPETEE